MTTKIAGGVIAARIALTLEAQDALSIGDAVMVTGNYECRKFDGTKPIVGDVVKPNYGRGSTLGVGGNAGYYPVAKAPGDVAVSARGHGVTTKVVGTTAVVAGTAVSLLAAGTVVPGGTALSQPYGIALMGGATGTSIDILVN